VLNDLLKSANAPPAHALKEGNLGLHSRYNIVHNVNDAAAEVQGGLCAVSCGNTPRMRV
jgi:hypothetical protein